MLNPSTIKKVRATIERMKADTNFIDEILKEIENPKKHKKND